MAKARPPEAVARPGGIALYEASDLRATGGSNDDDERRPLRTRLGVVTESEKKLKLPPMYKVLLHNDDYTTMEFVVQVLQSVFHKPPAEATQIMLHVHRNGIGVAGVYTYEVAETKVARRRGAGAPARVPAQVHDGRGMRAADRSA